MEAPPVGEPGRVRFPALDPEPPPRPWWRRLLMPAITLAVAGAASAGVSFALSPGPPGRNAAPRARHQPVIADGQVVAETAGGRLVVTAPGATRVTRLGKLGPYPPFPPLAPSADGRYAAAPSGDVLALSGPGLPASRYTRLTITKSVIPAPLGPFADHDRYLVLEDSNYGAQSTDVTVALGSLATGGLRTIAHADQVAADPAAPGAFFSAAAPPSPRNGALHGYPDSRVELRDAGRKPVVLATARSLARAVGMPARTPVTLAPFPSPDGGQVAIAVQPLPASPKQTTGIVVLTRAGKVAGAVPVSLGAVSPPVWNGSGTSLAFITPSSQGQALAMWSPSGQSQTVAIPILGVAFARCLWSPNGTSVLCSDQPGRHWALVPATGGAALGAVALMPGRGMPIAWMASRA